MYAVTVPACNAGELLEGGRHPDGIWLRAESGPEGPPGEVFITIAGPRELVLEYVRDQWGPEWYEGYGLAELAHGESAEWLCPCCGEAIAANDPHSPSCVFAREGVSLPQFGGVA